MSIIGVMSGVAVVGFSALADGAEIKGTVGLLEDRLDLFQLEVMNELYEKNTIHFWPDYLMVESEVLNPSLELFVKGVGEYPCESDTARLSATVKDGPVFLTKKEGNGSSLESFLLSENETFCVDFASSEDLEWQYQLSSGSERSNVIRFAHFNGDRSDLSDPIKLLSEDEIKIEFKSPYGQKNLYKNDLLLEEVGFLIKNSVDELEWNLSL